MNLHEMEHRISQLPEGEEREKLLTALEEEYITLELEEEDEEEDTYDPEADPRWQGWKQDKRRALSQLDNFRRDTF